MIVETEVTNKKEKLKEIEDLQTEIERKLKKKKIIKKIRNIKKK